EDVSDIAQEVMPIVDVEMPARVKKTVKKGQILMRDQLSQQGMVFRGDSVKLMLTDGGLMIETRAIAEQDGNVGQLVKVKPETSDAAVTALIVAPGVVKVEGM
ncbi:MAG TPA: flagellar basal body P-ring formation chaperone FlgA, partial [Burkholderiaceae bacterium]|nr:flagellar basal body P-ring formation chaperone FlgA [Burkholderiaceae bacterium]